MNLIENGTVKPRKIDNKIRNWVKVDNAKWMPNAIYVAQNNPDICGEWFEGCEVHHKDLDCTNDDPYNLICLSKEEHHRIHKEINENKGTMVTAYYKGTYFGSYPTLTKCSNATGIPVSYIWNYLKGKVVKSTKYDLTVWVFVQASS